MQQESQTTKPDNLLPWIKDGSYQNPEWQARVQETIIVVRGSSTEPGNIIWDLNNRTVI